MYTVTFFNEKGGTGKTTLTAMFGSYLAYALGRDVWALDFDGPSYQLYGMRKKEERMLSNDPQSRFAKDCAGLTPYSVECVKSSDAFTAEQLTVMSRNIRAQKLRPGDGFILLDFPGRFLPSDPVQRFVQDGLVDLMVVPIDSDRLSVTAALGVWQETRTLNPKQRILFLWNRETQRERDGRRDWYAPREETFARLDIPVVGKRVRDIVIARRDAGTFGYIRTTMCWPAANIVRNCPYLPEVFEEIRCRAEGTFDSGSQSGNIQ